MAVGRCFSYSFCYCFGSVLHLRSNFLTFFTFFLCNRRCVKAHPLAPDIALADSGLSVWTVYAFEVSILLQVLRLPPGANDHDGADDALLRTN